MFLFSDYESEPPNSFIIMSSYATLDVADAKCYLGHLDNLVTLTSYMPGGQILKLT